MTVPAQLPAPKFTINETVYLAESAAIGHLEGYHVGSIAYSATGEPVYTIQIKAKSGPAPTFGDRVLHKPSFIAVDSSTARQLGQVLTFFESELMTLCEALKVIKANLEERLAAVNVQVQGSCQGS